MSNDIQTINSGQQLSVDSMKSHVAIIDEMTKAVMQNGMHYGVIPGCGDKPTLLQPGAQKLALAFQLSVDPEVEINDLPGGHREYHVRCNLISRQNGVKVGTGLGNCSTMESRYRFRTQATGQEVPKAYWENRDSALLGGRQFSPKKVDGTWMIMEKIDHDNPADYFNTCEKMAKKRAFIDAILTCTAASDHFTQDIEDNPELYGGSAGVSTSKPVTTSESSKSSGTTQSTSDSGVITFGKNKGKKWSDVETGYLKWCVENAQKDFVKNQAQAELDRREKGTDTMNQSVEMANEQDIRLIRESAKAKDITVPDILEMFELDSMDKIRHMDVAPILAWIANPEEVPAKLAAF